MKIPDNNQHILFGGAFLLANKLQWVADRQLEGLPVKQWFLLRNLSEWENAPPPGITQLARALDSSRQNTARMLVAMERQGYVRLLPDEQDGRSRDVLLTPEGKTALEQMAQRSAGFFGRLFAGLSEGECAAAAGVMVRLVQNLEAMQEEINRSSGGA